MPVHIGDYMRDTGHLRGLEHGMYLMLMFHYWSTGSLPVDDRQLAAIARVTDTEWRKHKPTIQKFFADGWKHRRIDFDLAKAAKISKAAKEAGEASGRSRSVERPLNVRSQIVQRETNIRSQTVEPTLEPLYQKKKDAADAAPATLESELFARGKAVLGENSGGMIVKLLKSKNKNVPLARAAIETAATKENPREYIGAILKGGHPSEDGKRLTNDEVYWGKNRMPGIT